MDLISRIIKELESLAEEVRLEVVDTRFDAPSACDKANEIADDLQAITVRLDALRALKSQI